jgi:hypothetical protein
MAIANAQPARPGKRIVWRPQVGPQHLFVICPVFDVCYGGARGGGKTDATLGDWALHAKRYGKNAKGLLVRRTLVALLPTIDRAKEIFVPLGAQWNEGNKSFRWPNGAVLYFRYLDRDADADAYQGHDYTRVYVEELTQFISPKPVDKLKATLRSAAGVPTGFRATCNPGGPGHNWVKARYIDPGAWNIIRETFTNPFDNTTVERSRVFIPAKLSDNPRLLKNDPGYVANLQMAGSAELVRAWLEGDWNVIEGAFFDGWSSRNVVRPFTVPQLWTRFRSFDWGSARPFSVGWWAVASDDHETETVTIPRGALVRYREWYGSNGKPNEGLRMTAEEVATAIAVQERNDKIAYGVADPSIFREDGGPSIGERMRRTGLHWRPADNARVGANGAMSGWDQMRARIKGTEDGPMLVVFDTCRDFIRTVPVLQHDPDRPEDLDTDGEDHVADEARYACMSRPMTALPKVPSRNPPDLWGRQNATTNGWKSA